MTEFQQSKPVQRDRGGAEWKRRAGVRDHTGKPLPKDMVFFHAPPQELGEIITAYSTLRGGGEMKSTTRRLVVALAVAIPATAAVALMAFSAALKANDPSTWSLPAMMFAIGFSATRLLTRFSHTCSYVGTNGMCRYRQEGSRNAPVDEDLFYFHNATVLYVSETHQYFKGVYTGTNYDFRWSDTTGDVIYRLKGPYTSRSGNPKVSHPFCFARAGELAWSQFLMSGVEAQLEIEGFISFIAGHAKVLKVTRKGVELNWGSNVTFIAADEIKTMRVENEEFQIVHRDAGWFSSKGKFTFAHGSMANAQLFVLVVNRLLGLHVES